MLYFRLFYCETIICFILGAANLPVPKVAQAFSQAITNFMSTNPTLLKRIDVVIFEQRMLADFQAILTGSGSSSLNTQQPVASSTQNGITVNVSGGDILKSNCDILINTTNDKFDLTGICFILRSKKLS